MAGCLFLQKGSIVSKYRLFILFFITSSGFSINLSVMTDNSSSIILAGRESGGRLGDNVLLYCKAKYLSFKHGIPLVYRNFPFFDQFALSMYETLYTTIINSSYPANTLISNSYDLLETTSCSTSFEISYFCRMRKKSEMSGSDVGCGEYPFDWIKKKMTKYPEFGAELKRNLQILDKDARPRLPSRDCITVAVSTRMGCGGDDPFLYSEQFFSLVETLDAQPAIAILHDAHADGGNPFKFVPQQFYIDQVKRLSAMLLDRPMYIYLFIDRDKDFADGILAIWRSNLADYKNITIECNVEKKWDERVIDDLYCMSKCDCLIRGCSHFAGIAQLAGDHKIIMGPDPVSYFWADEKHLVFRKTFVYFQDVKQNKFEQYVYEDMDKVKLIAMAEQFFYTV